MTNKVTNYNEFIQEYIQVNDPVSGDYTSPTGLVQGIANKPSRQLQDAIAGLAAVFGFSGSDLKSELIDTDVPLSVRADIGYYFVKNKHPSGNYSNLTFDTNNTFGRTLSGKNLIKVLYNSTPNDIVVKNVYDCTNGSTNFTVPAHSALLICWNGLDRWVGNLMPSLSLNPLVMAKYDAIVAKWATSTVRPCDIIPGQYVTNALTQYITSGIGSYNSVVSIQKQANISGATSTSVPVVKQAFYNTGSSTGNKSAILLITSLNNTTWHNHAVFEDKHATNTEFGVVQTLDSSTTVDTYKHNTSTYGPKVVTGYSFYPLREKVESLVDPLLTVSNEDPNTTSKDWILTTSSNTPKDQYVLPDGRKYDEYYVHTAKVKRNDFSGVSRIQYAFPRIDNTTQSNDVKFSWSSTMFVRQFIAESSHWTPWVELGLTNQVLDRLQKIGYGFRTTLTTKDNVNLNTLSGHENTSGCYYVTAPSSVSTPQTTLNYPKNEARKGYLVVHDIDASNCVQTFYDIEHNITYVRSKYNNSWRSWKESAESSFSALKNKPTTLSGYGITDFKVQSDLGTADLNTITTSGVYGQTSNNNATTNRNYPQQEAGSLLVSPSIHGCMQQYTTYNKKEIWVRNKTGTNTWSQWKKVTSDGVPIGSIVSFPKEIENPIGFLKCDGRSFNQSSYPDLYRALGNRSTLPNLHRTDVGVMAWFPQDEIPNGWLHCDGSVLSRTTYPELHAYLASKYGTDKLPRVEDRFIRNAYGSLRVGTTQNDAIRDITGKFIAYRRTDRSYLPEPTGVFRKLKTLDGSMGNGGRDDWANEIEFKASRQVPTADENRPKSIVFKLCIKAKNTFDDVYFWIKAYGEVINAGALDASTLAADLSNLRSGKSDINHRHTASEIVDFVQQVDARINSGATHTSSGSFDIWKFPNGLMIQTCKLSIAQHQNSNQVKTFTWYESFASTPMLFGSAKSDVGRNDVRDMWVTFTETETTKSKVGYYVYEGTYNSPYTVNIHIMGIGSWK